MNLPYVLQDRSKGSISGNWNSAAPSSAPPKQLSSPNQAANIVVVNADITPQEAADQSKFGTPEIRSIGKPQKGTKKPTILVYFKLVIIPLLTIGHNDVSISRKKPLLLFSR